MPNMSYCRFENTLHALRDCHEHMLDSTDKMGKEEKAARLEMFGLIYQMAEELRDTPEDFLINGDPDTEED